jgi:hypothetical protein
MKISRKRVLMPLIYSLNIEKTVFDQSFGDPIEIWYSLSLSRFNRSNLLSNKQRVTSAVDRT